MCQALSNGDICQTCGRKFYRAVGRRLTLSDAKIKAVIKNHLSQAKTQAAFCKKSEISPYTYRSIVYGRVKNVKDRERINKIAVSLGYSITWK